MRAQKIMRRVRTRRSPTRNNREDSSRQAEPKNSKKDGPSGEQRKGRDEPRQSDHACLFFRKDFSEYSCVLASLRGSHNTARPGITPPSSSVSCEGQQSQCLPECAHVAAANKTRGESLGCHEAETDGTAYNVMGNPFTGRWWTRQITCMCDQTHYPQPPGVECL